MGSYTSSFVIIGALALLFTGRVQAQHLYWVQAGYSAPKIRMMTPDGKGLTSVALTPGSLPHGLSLTRQPSLLIWASGVYQNAHLFSVSPTFSRIDSLANGGGESSFQGVAVDTVNGKVYWTTSSIAQGCSIRRANLDGSGEDSLISYPANGPENLRGIALDLVHHTMYWTDFGAGIVRRATLDGANPQDVVAGLDGPLGIAVDVPGGKIYWCEANAHAIRSATLDGASVTTLVSGIFSPQYLAIDPGDSLMYWTELAGNGHGKIRRSNLDGSEPVTMLGNQSADSVLYPSGIAFLGAGAATGIQSASVPLQFSLEQNYPNPINPTTTLQFVVGGVVAPSGAFRSGVEGPATVISGQWPVVSVVRIGVYDILGREVAAVADGLFPAGKYSFTFDGSKLASGVYFYRLNAGNFSAVRKMTLVK